ncbi:MAG: hypothetical protein OXF93_14055 [Acidobacteria bacterium]|nr:hypothetical protein [Acidobacteriota bacterium]
MLLVLDLRVGGVELVGHRGEQQRAHSLAVVRLGPEEFLGQIGRGIALRPLRTEQVLEALKLVEDDEIGLEGLDARAGEQAAQIGDDPVSRVPRFGWPRSVAPEPGVEQLAEPTLQVRPLVERRLEASAYRVVDGPGVVLQPVAKLVALG